MCLLGRMSIIFAHAFRREGYRRGLEHVLLWPEGPKWYDIFVAKDEDEVKEEDFGETG